MKTGGSSADCHASNKTVLSFSLRQITQTHRPVRGEPEPGGKAAAICLLKAGPALDKPWSAEGAVQAGGRRTQAPFKVEGKGPFCEKCFRPNFLSICPLSCHSTAGLCCMKRKSTSNTALKCEDFPGRECWDFRPGPEVCS